MAKAKGLSLAVCGRPQMRKCFTAKNAENAKNFLIMSHRAHSAAGPQQKIISHRAHREHRVKNLLIILFISLRAL